VSGFLIDTNVLSELRRRKRNQGVVEWLESTTDELLYLSVITLGEIRRGIRRLHLHDPIQAVHLEKWLEELRNSFAHRILTVDGAVALRWGELGIHQPISVADGLLAATAMQHGLTLVTRNVRDFQPNGIPVLNPFQ
jgi:predicted nucleic acid-binding protein